MPTTREQAEALKETIISYWRGRGYPQIWAETYNLGMIGLQKDGPCWTVISNLTNVYPPKDKSQSWWIDDIEQRKKAAAEMRAKAHELGEWIEPPV